MKLAQNTFLAGLRAGEKQIGLWCAINSSAATDIVAHAGYDWLVVDMEHSPTTEATVLTQLQAVAGGPSTAFVRPAWNDPVLIKRVLDIGPSGLVVPMIETVQDAEKAVSATRYPPRGIRGVAAGARASGYGRMSDYFQRVEEETALILQVETRSALALSKQIGTVDGVDGVFFGPADISADIGMLGQPLAPAVWEAIWASAQPLIDANIPVGTLVSDPEFAIDLFNRGFSFVAVGTDAGLLARGADALRAGIRDAIS